jgi:hypothetical protein
MSSPAQQGRKTGTAPSTARSVQWLNRLWIGGGKPAIRWRSLVGGVLVLLLSNIIFTIGLVGVRFDMPVKLVGIVCLLLAAFCIFLGVRALLRFVFQLGLRRLLIFLTVLYFIAVFLTGAVLETDKQGAGHWVASAGVVANWTIEGIGNLGRSVLQAPDTVSFAATGRRQPIKVPGGVEWVDGVPPTPIVVPAPSGDGGNAPTIPEPNSQTEGPGSASESSGRAWQVGDTVRIVRTEGAPLRARATPSTDAQIVARFPPNSILHILGGPETVDGRVWWEVQGENGEGWCAADYLTLEAPQ